jgi:hypothetical protein
MSCHFNLENGIAKFPLARLHNISGVYENKRHFTEVGQSGRPTIGKT